jgi:HEAT repeat protein
MTRFPVLLVLLCCGSIMDNARFSPRRDNTGFMGNKRRILLGVLLLAVGGIFLWRLDQPRDPVYRGEPLSQWLNEYDPRILINNKGEVDDAIRNIGTNAIPTLLGMLRSKDNAIKAAALKDVERTDLIWVTLAEERNAEAARGFEALGASAKDAVPALIEIYEQRISPASQSSTAYALGCIGPGAKEAIPQLLQGATNANNDLRRCAIRSLGQIHSAPEVSVPALIRALDDTNHQTRYEAANALGIFGTNATAAIPALVRAFKSQDKHIYSTAADALKAIDAEAAAKAGVK